MSIAGVTFTFLGVTTGMGGVACYAIVFGGSSTAFSAAGGYLGEKVYDVGQNIVQIGTDMYKGLKTFVIPSPNYYLRVQ